ncbi:leucine-rich repeat domain-containing protein [Sulfurimonas sp. MAG313]|nr:leucine-rich repeat domain-containing protein [Sulfurimonas sp. MAG313]MDF1881280.1 leucine-rich repeat domain-containing protein [Sulfurimonas sp. MAG313]
MIEEALRRIKITKKENLSYLNLRGLDLKEVPKEILEVPWIGALSLSNNNIKNIEILSNMKNVHKLALSNNLIEDISVLEYMTKLRFIFLGHNRINNISTIKNQERLKKLVLESNKITSFPDLSHFKLLAYLDLSNNPLKLPSIKEIKIILPSLKIFKY